MHSIWLNLISSFARLRFSQIGFANWIGLAQARRPPFGGPSAQNLGRFREEMGKAHHFYNILFFKESCVATFWKIKFIKIRRINGF